jgi:hypothetical protein
MHEERPTQEELRRGALFYVRNAIGNPSERRDYRLIAEEEKQRLKIGPASVLGLVERVLVEGKAEDLDVFQDPIPWGPMHKERKSHASFVVPYAEDRRLKIKVIQVFAPYAESGSEFRRTFILKDQHKIARIYWTESTIQTFERVGQWSDEHRSCEGFGTYKPAMFSGELQQYLFQ